MIKKDKKIELLAPAKDKITAIAAINAGADAIYIGYKKFGARKSAGNSIEDIKDIVDYADKFRVNVYVTLNTIYTDEEIVFVIKLINELYEIGVSAIIIQDMGILEYKLPPIRIFASTQCHNNTLEKIKFLEETGFDRVIVPREFSLEYIKNITNNTNIDIETFIHGALCISYSGQCYLSYCNGGRSANRGECAQPCRKKYSLLSSNGDIIEKDKYLLSLKDLNLSDSIEDLILSGVTSFKIEGRLKDSCYVTNIVAFYRQEIDKILDKYNISRTSQGKSFVDFEPNPYKSFNRDFTNFNIDGKRKDICTKHYVKSIGEYIGVVEKVENKFFTLKKGKKLNNGDGICFFNEITGELQGTLVQKSEYNRIFPQNIKDIKKNIKIYRNSDILFEKELKKDILRVINISAKIKITSNNITVQYKDEENNIGIINKNINLEKSKNGQNSIKTIETQFMKTGGTEFKVQKVEIDTDENYFIRISELNELRREAIEELRKIRRQNLKKEKRKSEIKKVKYPIETLDYRANILNKSAEKFYKTRGVQSIEYAIESKKNISDKILMTSKHCLKYSCGLCKKYFKNIKNYKEPLYLVDNNKKYLLEFDCINCIMLIKNYI